MSTPNLTRWWKTALHQEGGNILIIQTLRNALMGASVLASTALVALMGVFATMNHAQPWVSLGSALLLIASIFCATRALSSLGEMGFSLTDTNTTSDTVESLQQQLWLIRLSAWLLVLALIVAALRMVVLL